MKQKITQTIEQVVDCLEISDLSLPSQISRIKLVELTNKTGLDLEFYESSDQTCSYKMRITEKGISFERYLSRPKHDHDDIETLQISIDKNKSHIENGALVWRKRFPYLKEGFDHFYVPFGKVIESTD